MCDFIMELPWEATMGSDVDLGARHGIKVSIGKESTWGHLSMVTAPKKKMGSVGWVPWYPVSREWHRD